MHLDLAEYLTQPLSSVVAAMSAFSPKPILGDIRLRDLATPRGEATGLYAFFGSGQCATPCCRTTLC